MWKKKEDFRGVAAERIPLGVCAQVFVPKQEEERDDQRPKTTVTLPYISGLSEAVRPILAPLDIQVLFRPLSTLRHMLVHSKDAVTPEEQKGVVYCVSCEGCPMKYIGQTGRSLKHRLAEHRRERGTLPAVYTALL